MAFCHVCGEVQLEGARFCSRCGAPLGTATEPGEERKLATVLFADLVGSTALAAADDPERTRALLTRFYEAMAVEVGDAGGMVEKFAGDAVMAAFGVPAALEDHAERALHAALAMQRRLDELFAGKLALRIGINTGDVVAGRPHAGSSFVAGDAVNVAARLEQSAEPGQILVGERTALIVGGAFELSEPEIVQAKGKEGGVAARQLVRALSLARPRGVGGLPPTFVGREEELEALRSALREVQAERRPQVVSVIGPAGVGKTRLIRELWALLATDSPETVRRTGRCISYGQGITYAPIGEIVREHFGLLESDPPQAVRRRLGDWETLGLTLGLEAPSDLHPLAARDRLHLACAEFFDMLATEASAVILVEDVHWAEQALLELLDSVVRDVRAPVLLIMTMRPEGQAARGDGRDRTSKSIWLEPLTSDAAVDMVDAILPGGASPRLRDEIVRRAEGNPFFVEELVGTLIDRGVLQQTEGAWSVTELPDELDVPDTVQALLSARIDLLEPADKAALQAAAVIGRVFWLGPIYELLDGLEPDLRLLEDRDFIRRQPGSSIAGEREFLIKHALTREVAYASVPKAKRARLHARFAGWLERAGGGRDEHAALLAHHYAEATRPEDADLAWGGDDKELARLRSQAGAWLRRAAELAFGRYDMQGGLALLHRALELEDDREGKRELWRRIAQANALYFDSDGFSAAMQHVIELADSPELVAEAYADLAFHTLVRSGMWRVLPDPALVDTWIEQALERAAQGTPSRAKALIARCYVVSEKPPELAAEASTIAEHLGDAPLRSYGYDVLGLTAFAAGEYEEALGWLRRRIALADEIDDLDHRADIYASAIAPAIARGAFEEARRYTSVHDEYTRMMSPHHRLHGISAVVELEELLGNWARIQELQAQVEAAVAENAATPCVRNQRSLLVCALASAYAGDDAESSRLEQAADTNAMEGYGTVIDAPRARLALQRGLLDDAVSLLGRPTIRRTTWFFLSSAATHLEVLAALGESERVEADVAKLAEANVYLEPFALRALGTVREDQQLVARAAERFQALGLEWHAEQTREAGSLSRPRSPE